MWTIGTGTIKARGNLEGAKTEFGAPLPQPEQYGVHPTRKAAIRAGVTLVEPEVAGGSDDFLMRFWRPFSRNLGLVAVRVQDVRPTTRQVIRIRKLPSLDATNRAVSVALSRSFEVDRATSTTRENEDAARSH